MLSLYLFEAFVFVAYSFFAAIITAGGSLITINALTFGGLDLIKAAGVNSAYIVVNCAITAYVFRKEIIWRAVGNLLPVTIIGAFLGALFLVNIEPVLLLSLMFVFSLYFIIKKLRTPVSAGIEKDSVWKEQLVGLFAGAVSGAALPGGGFVNAYLGSKGFTLSQMFGTVSIVFIVTFAIKVGVMIEAGLLSLPDFGGIALAFPFLIVSNILVRKGLLSLSKSATDKITIVAMTVFSVYALASIVKELLR